MSEITVEQLKYRYPSSEHLALDGFTFHIKTGEFVGIIGRNGSGKSTLCQALAGLVPHFYKGAYGGKVLLDDLEVRNTEISRLCKKAGIVFQNPFNQITGSKLSVFEEIAFGLENLGIPKPEMQQRIEEAMELLGISRFRDRNPFELSGGQMQRMAIASVLAMKPDIMILDEPTSQLDPQGREEVYQAVSMLAEKGITIILAEHNMEKIAYYCDRVLLLHDGRQIDFDTPQKIFSREDLEQYGVEAPVFSRIGRALDKKDTATGCYSVTLEETTALFLGTGV